MTIQHNYNEQKGEFFVCNELGEKIAYLTYQYVDTNTIDAQHTFVDDRLRGQGIANQLYLALSQWVKENHLNLIASCSYIKTKVRSKN